MNNILDFPLSYGFEDIAISQQKNIVKSRLDVQLKSEIFKDTYINIPLIASNMSTVVDANFCIKLYEFGALGIMHRAGSKEFILNEIKKIAKNCNIVAASVG